MAGSTSQQEEIRIITSIITGILAMDSNGTRTATQITQITDGAIDPDRTRMSSIGTHRPQSGAQTRDNTGLPFRSLDWAERPNFEATG